MGSVKQSYTGLRRLGGFLEEADRNLQVWNCEHALTKHLQQDIERPDASGSVDTDRNFESPRDQHVEQV